VYINLGWFFLWNCLLFPINIFNRNTKLDWMVLWWVNSVRVCMGIQLDGRMVWRK